MMKKSLIGPIILLLGIFIFTFSQPYIPYGARMNSGKIHYNEGRFEKAAEQFAFAVEENPNSAEARIWLAMSYYQIQQYPIAAAQFDTAFSKDSIYYKKMEKNEDFKFQARSSFLAMSRDYLASSDTNDWITALHYVKHSFRLDPKSRQALTMLAQLYVQLNRLDDLKQQAMVIVKNDAENPQGYNMLALYFFNRTDWDSAHYYYLESGIRHQLNERKSKEMLSSQLVIKDTIQLNQTVTSLVAARKDRNPKRLTSYIEDSLKVKPKLRTIVNLADDLYITRSELNTSYFRAGIASLQQANTFTEKEKQESYFKQAEAEFSQALSYNPSDLDAKHNLAFIYYRQGGIEADQKAMAIYEEIIKNSVLPLPDPLLASDIVDSLLLLITDKVISNKYTIVPADLVFKIENNLAVQGLDLIGWQYLYFPTLTKSQLSTPTRPVDKKEIFLSTLDNKALENLYLLYGSTQANVAMGLKQEEKLDEAMKQFDEAIITFKLVLALNPKNTDAIKSLGVCYSEKGEKKKAFELLKTLDDLKKGK